MAWTGNRSKSVARRQVKNSLSVSLSVDPQQQTQYSSYHCSVPFTLPYFTLQTDVAVCCAGLLLPFIFAKCHQQFPKKLNLIFFCEVHIPLHYPASHHNGECRPVVCMLSWGLFCRLWSYFCPLPFPPSHLSLIFQHCFPFLFNYPLSTNLGVLGAL